MRERAKRIGGELRLHGEPAKGTILEVLIRPSQTDGVAASDDALGMI
jgi:nitrate/nitrite-specific signal transduction histidine kinase